MSININFGALLTDHIAKNKVSKTALADVLKISSSNLEARLKRTSIQADVLLKICDALNHNFFADIAALMPVEFSTSTNPDITKDERIAELELEVKMLQRERDVLSGVISGRMG
ncbi:helix-turn-helix domain-containing protein [Flavobacterium sp. 3HN19-14]|uniref:helix-turn-helix domain-containing protein n=1 Tax=Flavobacterium sp. 3HN19-14 TaxID=3448133 RepID=UPI003EDFFE12